MNGYALVNEKNEAFGWYRTLAEAQIEQKFQKNVYCSALKIVKDVEATWPVIAHP